MEILQSDFFMVRYLKIRVSNKGDGGQNVQKSINVPLWLANRDYSSSFEWL